MVRNKMNQMETTRTRIPEAVWIARPVPIEQGYDEIDSVREKIRTGQAYLKVVEYPWGVEFDICEVGEGR